MPETVTSSNGTPSSLTDAIGIGTLTRLVPRELTDEVIASEGRTEIRKNKFPARVMVYFVMAMALFYGDSYEEVMRKLADGFDYMGTWRKDWDAQSRGSVSWLAETRREGHAGALPAQTTGAGTTSYSYLGASSEVASESDPGSTSKTYDYIPAGARLSQTTTSGGTFTPGYYSYNANSEVEAVTGSSGTTTATYGYTAYGSPVTSMFTGADKTNATPPPRRPVRPSPALRGERRCGP